MKNRGGACTHRRPQCGCLSTRRFGSPDRGSFLTRMPKPAAILPRPIWMMTDNSSIALVFWAHGSLAWK